MDLGSAIDRVLIREQGRSQKSPYHEHILRWQELDSAGVEVSQLVHSCHMMNPNIFLALEDFLFAMAGNS